MKQIVIKTPELNGNLCHYDKNGGAIESVSDFYSYGYMLQRVAHYRFDGTEDISMTMDGCFVFECPHKYFSDDPLVGGLFDLMISNNFTWKCDGTLEPGEFCGGKRNEIYLKPIQNCFESADEFKKYLAYLYKGGSPLEIMYILDEPVISRIPYDESGFYYQMSDLTFLSRMNKHDH